MVTKTEEPVVEPTAPEAAPARHPLHDMMKGYYPDKEYPDDNALMDDAHSKMGELDGYYKENEAKNEEFINFLADNPEWREAIVYGMKGVPLRAVIARMYDPEDLVAEDGDPDFEQVQASREERKAKRAEAEAFQAELQANIEASQEEIKAFAEENGMDEESSVSFLGNVTQVLEDAYKGKITKDFLARMYTAENHEKEVAAAAENGVIEGKNAKIDEMKAIERESKAGDSLPSIASVSAVPVTPAKKEPTIGGKFLTGTGV